MPHPTNDDEDRRSFLEKAGKAAFTVPAAAMLLAAASKGAMANPYGRPPRGHGNNNGNGNGNDRG